MGRLSPRPVIGWREWAALPELGVPTIKAKVDTGARTSALHAFGLDYERNGHGADLVSFAVHPQQRSSAGSVPATAEVVGWRRVRSSNGIVEQRPVISTLLELGGDAFPIELTLTNRDEMGFRMLLGRAAIRRRYLVDPGRSFLTGGPEGRP